MVSCLRYVCLEATIPTTFDLSKELQSLDRFEICAIQEVAKMFLGIGLLLHPSRGVH